MSLARTNFILSNVNALLGSTVGAMNDSNNGVDPGTTIMNFGLNVMNGAARNAVAYDIRKMTGSSIGFLITGMAGYGNQEANIKGSTALMGASLMTSMMGPFGWNGGWFGGGCFGPSIFGGGCFGPPVAPMPPMMGFPTSHTEINITTNGRGFRHWHF